MNHEGGYGFRGVHPVDANFVHNSTDCQYNADGRHLQDEEQQPCSSGEYWARPNEVQYWSSHANEPPGFSQYESFSAPPQSFGHPFEPFATHQNNYKYWENGMCHAVPTGPELSNNHVNFPHYGGSNKTDFNEPGRDTQNAGSVFNLFDNSTASGLLGHRAVEYQDDIVRPHPSFISATTFALPSKKKLAESVKLPYGVLFTPFSSSQEVVNIPCSFIMRCGSCCSYLNPYCKLYSYNAYVCSICLHRNTVSDAAMNDSVAKAKNNIGNRLETRFSSFEYEAPTSYSKGPPPPLSLVFLLDVSANKDCLAYVDVVCEAIREGLAHIDADKRSTLTILAFDSLIHSFSLKDTNGNLHIEHNIIADIDDPFFVTHGCDSIHFKGATQVDVFLRSLPDIVKSQSQDTSGCCFGSAIDYSVKLLSRTGGGRITAFLCNCPSFGVGAYKPRREAELSSTREDESSMFLPSSGYFKTLGMDIANKGITVDLFVATKSNLDLAQLAPLVQFCGGEIFSFVGFDSSSLKNRRKLVANILNYLKRSLYLDVSLSIRLSHNIEVQSYLGHYFVSGNQKFTVPVMNNCSTLSTQLFINDNLENPASLTCVQVSMVYTTPKGERKLRVHTLPLKIVSSARELVNSVNPACVAALLLRLGVERILLASVQDTREAFINSFVDTCTSFMSAENQKADYSSCMLPTRLYELSVLTHALLRCETFSAPNFTRIDRRIQQMAAFRTWPLEPMLVALRPALFDIDGIMSFMSTGKGLSRAALIDSYGIPPCHQNVKDGSVYLLDSGSGVFVYITRNTQNSTIQQITNAPDYESMPDLMVSIPVIGNYVNEVLHSFINRLVRNRTYVPSVAVFKSSCTVVLQKFTDMLILDKRRESPSYQEFLSTVRKKILDLT